MEEGRERGREKEMFIEMHQSIIQGLSNNLAFIIHIVPVPPLLSFLILSDPDPKPSILEHRFLSHLISSHLVLLSDGLFRRDAFGLSHFTSFHFSSFEFHLSPSSKYVYDNAISSYYSSSYTLMLLIYTSP